MANHLKMAKVQTIQVLREQGWSYRRIARELGVGRNTVKRYVELNQAGTDPPGGSDGQTEPNPPAGFGHGEPAASGPASRCEPYRERILSAQRIWQDLRDEGFADGYDSVKRYVRRLGQAGPVPFRRMECVPGAEAQVDFGTGAPAVILSDRPLSLGVKTRRRTTHVFRFVLRHSRKACSEVVYGDK